MLAHKHRFHRRNQVNRINRQGKSVRGGVISLKYKYSPNTDARVAVVVSKKVAKSAVVRNRIRRRVFEIIRKNFDEVKPGLEVIIGVFDASVADMPADELQKTILNLLAQAK